MPRRCVTVPGPGRCCQAFTQGAQPGQIIRFPAPNNPNRMICGVCHIVTKRARPGQQARRGFRFTFAPGCGGADACPALNPAGGSAGTPMLTTGGQLLTAQGAPMLIH